ncbi:hypothetical protein B9479_008202 [Cryptococcus floricola]|uniref:Uncharacterized protein n=1 Tax=Cryptococcus floricola TaxID=2591691 RepID=A0A5D3AI24_9TREE|nr:hypothetical protein B9479_008202 [Cryptococcus floricola]
MSDGKREEQEEQDWAIPGGVSLGYGPTTFGAPTEDATPATSESCNEPDTAPLDPSANTGGGAESRVGSTQSTMSPTHWKDFRRACFTLCCPEVEQQQESDGTMKALAALNYTTPSNLNPTFSEEQFDVADNYYDSWNPPFRSFEENGKPEFDVVTAMAVLDCKEEPNEVVWEAMYAADGLKRDRKE